MIVDVTPGMTLAQVIIRLRESQGDSVTVRILPDSSLLLTANEFRALALAAEREQIAIAVETEDALRRQLASLFGVPLSIPINIPEAFDAPSDDPEHPASESSMLANGTARETPLATNGQVAAEPAPAGEETGSVQAISETPPDVAKRRNGKAVRRWFLVVTSLAVVVAVVLAGYWWFFSTATVQLALQSQPVTTNVSFTVVPPGAEVQQNGQITIPAEHVTFPLSVALEAPATGITTVGDLTAAGPVVLRNPGSEAVTIAAGSEITTFEGDVFVFQEDVPVPAATPEGSAGEATAIVNAAEPGVTGNRDVGMLSGQLDNGVYFSNRTTPVAGGTDQTLIVVTEDDVANLQAEAERALLSLASTSSLSGNLRVVPSSLTQSDLQTAFSHQAGDEAETLTLEATVTFDASAFSTEALDASARESLLAVTPAGYELLPNQMIYDVPIETGAANGSRAMIVPVRGQTVAAVSSEEFNQIARELTGLSESEAEAFLETQELVTSHSLSFKPDWLPHRMPNDADRISVVVE